MYTHAKRSRAQAKDLVVLVRMSSVHYGNTKITAQHALNQRMRMFKVLRSDTIQKKKIERKKEKKRGDFV